MIRMPRVPIGTLMLAVVFIALDCAAIRGFSALVLAHEAGDLIEIGPALIVVGSLLFFQLGLRMLRGWRTKCLVGSFAAGFQLATWGAVVALMLILLARQRALEGYMELVSSGLDSPVGYLLALVLGPESFAGQSVLWIYEAIILALVFGVPLLGVGLLGGLVFRWLGIVVEVRWGRRRSGDGAGPGPAPPVG